MVSEIEIKVSESGTLTEIGSIGFQFRDNEHLFIYLFIYLFIHCCRYGLFNILLFN